MSKQIKITLRSDEEVTWFTASSFKDKKGHSIADEKVPLVGEKKVILDRERTWYKTAKGDPDIVHQVIVEETIIGVNVRFDISKVTLFLSSFLEYQTI